MSPPKNREYQKRATKQGLGRLVAEDFYRPAIAWQFRPEAKKASKSGPLSSFEQLKLDFGGAVSRQRR